MNLDRPVAPNPYDLLPKLPSFTLTSPTLRDGDVMPDAQLADGGNTSPALEWSNFPAETKSFIVTCFDPDAPTPSGFWHWAIMDLDASVTSLEADAGKSDLFLPDAAAHICNDAGVFAYYGAAPPKGDHPHRYIFAVTALDTETLELDADDLTPARLSFAALDHSLARATLTVTYRH